MISPVTTPIATNRPSSELDQQLANLLAEAVDKLRAGEPVDLSDYVRRYPDFAERLEQLLPAMQALAELGHAQSTVPSSVAGRVGPFEEVRGTLGDFRILREIGRGGMGVVYEAEQISLGRRMALKVLPFAGVLDERQLTRFRNEARAAASLKHPNIVGVHSVGCERGVHYYAMEFIEGKTLADVIAALRQGAARAADAQQPTEDVTPGGDGHVGGSLRDPQNPVSARPDHVGAPLRDALPVSERPDHVKVPAAADTDQQARAETSTQKPGGTKDFFRRVAEWGIQAAEGLEHAHQMGIVHRDVKPSNLLVDASGHLWITDFGLAQVQTDAGITMTGDILGTLRYMSPEQAAGRSRVLDHRTDIYSLGVTLYELLTLRPPFSGNDRQTVLRQIGNDEPPAPRQLNKAIPKDLETIVLKALAKEPQARFATAQNLGDDLKRFLADEPIRARRPTLVNRAAKWVRRHRPLVGSVTAVVAIAAVAGGAMLWTSSSRALRLERDAGQHLAAAEAFLRAADFPRAERELADLRGHLETAGYGQGRLSEKMAALAQQLSAKTQAIGRFDQFQKLRHRIHSEMYAVDRTILDQAQEHCRTALDLFGAFQAGPWKSQASCRDLDAERRVILDEGVVELLFIWARLEIGKSVEKPAAEQVAGLRRVIEALSKIETFRAPVPAVYLWIADSWEAIGDKKAAAEARTQAEAIRPTSAMDHFILAEHHARHGRLEEALVSYGQTLTQRPDHYLAFLASGVVLGDLKRYETAEAMLTGAIAMKPQTVLAYTKRAISRLEQGKIILAQADLCQARSLDPDLARALTRRAHAYGANFEFDKALADCNEAIRLDPNLGLALAERSGVHYRMGDLDAALADHNDAIRLDPKDASGYLGRSNIYRMKGLTDEALADCNEAIRLAPNSGWGYWVRASIYTDRREWEKALTDLNEAMRLAPNEGRVFLARGKYYRSRGERDKALADFDEAIRLDPKYIWSFDSRAGLYRDAGEFDKSLADHNEAIRLVLARPNEAIRLTPDLCWLYDGRAATHRAQNDLDKAIADHNEAIRLRPKLGWLYARRAATYRAKGDSDKALADLNEAVRLDPNHSVIWMDLAELHQLRGERDQSLVAFDKAIQLNANNAWALNGRATLLRDQGDFAKALTDHDEAIRICPKFAWLHVGRGKTYAAKRDWDKALADYSEAIRLDPKAADAFKARAEVHKSRGDLDKALAECNEALRLNPKDSLAYYVRGQTSAGMGDLDKAFADYSESIRTGPNLSAYHSRADIYRVRGQLDKALADNNESVRIEPGNPWNYSQRGLTYQALRDWDKALADFDQSIRLDPTHIDGYCFRAAVHKERGDSDKALADYTEAIRVAPKDRFAYECRAQFYLEKGDFDKAAADFDLTAELGTMSWHLWKHRGVAHFQLKHYDKALESIAKAVELRPDDSSNLRWIPPAQVAKCPDERLRQGLLELADKAIEKTKGAAHAYLTRAVLLEAYGRDGEANADFEKAQEAVVLGTEDADDCYLFALARLRGGQLQGYQKTCAEILQRFAKTQNAGDAHWVAWTCALAPDATTDWPTAIALAEKAATSDPKSTLYLNTLGAILYRAGQFEEAAKKLTEAEALVSAPSGTAVSSPAYSWFFLAMTQQRLQQSDAAKASFDKAVAETDKALREHEQGIAETSWNRRLTLKLLRAEAAALLGISDTPPTEKEKTEGKG